MAEDKRHYERVGSELSSRSRLPRRYPFLLVDRVVEMEFQKSAIGYKNVTMNDNFFTGHFPERAIMPGNFSTLQNRLQIRALHVWHMGFERSVTLTMASCICRCLAD